jgi:hypothetical protein
MNGVELEAQGTRRGSISRLVYKMVMMVNLSEEACRIGKWATVLGF